MTLRRPSPALLLAAAALFVALGGPAAAEDAFTSAKKKITGKRIAKNAITSKHIKNGKVKEVDLAPGVIPDAYTRTESDGRYLGAGGKAADADRIDGRDSTEFLARGAKAADADQLDGFDSGAFMQGDAHHGSATTLPEGTERILFSIPERLRVVGECVDNNPPLARVRLEYQTGWSLMQFERTASGATTVGAETTNLSPGDETPFASGAGNEQHVTVLLSRLGELGGSEVIRFEAFSSDDGVDECRYGAVATANDDREHLVVVP